MIIFNFDSEFICFIFLPPAYVNYKYTPLIH